jgi:hypothetical protein
MKTLKVKVDPIRLHQMRHDLDSDAEGWVRAVPESGTNKLQAMTAYLDELLRLFGEPGTCPVCRRPKAAQETDPE